MDAQFFDTAADLRDWFAEHHETAPELFVGYWKKGTGGIGVSHPEAIEQGRMYPGGLRAFELRKTDQIGVYAYEQPEAVQFDAEQTARLQAEPAAWEWFSRQPPGYRRSATHWVVTAKRADTRDRRLAQLIADSAAGRKVPPLIPR